MNRTQAILGSVSLAAITFGCANSESNVAPMTKQDVEDGRPNVILIVTDDMGYSDFSPFGGEIRTPNIQRLADSGVSMTNFYASPSCSPSRSQLLTGTDNHTAGIGTMEEWLAVNQEGEWGYEGHLPDRVATLAESLDEVGYFTAMTGKWHLGKGIAQDPFNRGFDRAFTLLEGMAPHFADKSLVSPLATYTYRMDGEPTELPEDFYSSRFYTDTLIDFLEGRDEEEPFFGYLAFTAPHDPMQVPDEWLDRYKGEYDNGYEALRAQRLERLKELGVIDSDTVLPPQLPWVPAWDSLTPEQQASLSRNMEIYASMIEYVDQEIGRLMNWLEEEGELENTLIVFFSDNGANGSNMTIYPGSSPEWVAENFDNSLENIGRRGSGVDMGPGWAQASMTPFLYYKGFMSEGGVRSPAVLSGYGVSRNGEIHDAVASVRDIYPTVLELTGASHPTTLGNRDIVPQQGISMVPFLSRDSEEVRTADTPYIQELFNGRMVRAGKWKALYMEAPFGINDWQLYDMTQDATELVDLSAEYPEELARLIEEYESFAKEVRIIKPPFGLSDILAGTVNPNDVAHSPE
jgi:arylsulfatase A-like enzyme